MTPDDAQALSDMLTDCYALYGRDFAPQMLVLWFEALREYQLEDVSRALTLHVKNPDAGQYPPKPADVTKHLQGGGGVRAMAAWGVVARAISSVGHYSSVCFDDPIIHRCIDDMGGWVKLASIADAKELPFRGNEFQKLYQGALLAGGVGDDYAPYLVGVAESHNNALPLDQVRSGNVMLRLVGDVDKCRAVMKNGKGASGLRVTDATQNPAALLAAPVLKIVGKKGA
jgi:hypothetical protein